MNLERDIFKKSSTTFYLSSKFFPEIIRRDVLDLYSFVRLADDYVDMIPADSDGFYRLRRIWMDANKNKVFSTKKLETDSIGERAIKNMMRLVEQRSVQKEWVEEFLNSMQSDLVVKEYKTIKDSLRYVYGSAEVVGLMMCRIMDLPEEAEEAAMMQGRALQWINFIRDIDEDNNLGRQYFPSHDLKNFNLKDLSQKTAATQPEDFAEFVQYQIDRYKKWQAQARQGYKFIPKRLRIPIQAAADANRWVANEIGKNPMVVFEKKVKPSRLLIIKSAVKHTVTS